MKSSKYIGVTLDRRCRIKKWVAYIKKDGRQITLGFFETEEEAHRARERALGGAPL